MYNYKEMRPFIFRERGVTALLIIRDNVMRCLAYKDIFTFTEACKTVGGDSFLMLACLDYLIERREIRMVDDSHNYYSKY